MKLTLIGTAAILAVMSGTFMYHRHNNENRYIDVDFSKPSSEKRLCVMEHSKAIYCTWVTHGRNSGELYATRFSNENGSGESSLGKLRVGESYYGKHGLSYRLDGLEPGKNDNVRSRAIVIHEADYIGYGRTGRSLGCLAVPTDDIETLFKYIYTGMIIKAHV
jgi:hypothetical protein